jgi:uncharacterized membrane protein (UPF0127 family)
MPWLVRDDQVLATLEVQTSWRGRARGLLGRDGIDGAILLRPARAVHTMRMRFAIDVAFCDRDLVVVKVVTLVPYRVTRPVLRARSVVECEAGMLRKWGIVPGTRLEVRGWDGDEDGDAHRLRERLRRIRPTPQRASRREPTGT